MRRRLASAILLLSIGPACASAHVGHVISRAERYLKLDVAGRSARVVVSLTLGPEVDGVVSAAESDSYLAQRGDGLRTELPLRVDGAEVHPAWGDGWLDPLGPVRAVPVTVEMVAWLPLEGGEQTITFEDRMVRREVFDRTDVAFRVRDGATLVASGDDEAPTEPVEDLYYLGDFRAGAPIPLTAVVTTPEPPSSTPWWLVALGAVVAGGAAFALRTALARRRDA